MRSTFLCMAACVVFGLLAGAAPALAASRGVVAGGGGSGAILGALLCGYLASTKGRNPWGWALFGFFCCPIALLCVLLAGPGDYR